MQLISRINWETRRRENDRLKLLSLRENQVREKLVQGASNKVIANDLFISEPTVKSHLRSIMGKLQVRNRIQIATLITGESSGQ